MEKIKRILNSITSRISNVLSNAFNKSEKKPESFQSIQDNQLSQQLPQLSSQERVSHLQQPKQESVDNTKDKK